MDIHISPAKLPELHEFLGGVPGPLSAAGRSGSTRALYDGAAHRAAQ